MIVVWIAVLIAGLASAALASRRAVGNALDLADSLGVSAGLIGLSVLAVGTDLPEIATSVIASVTEHGDLAVGDATGSALAQITLILALLLLAGGPMDLTSREHDDAPVAVPLGLLTVGALLLLAVLLADERLHRWNGALLVTAWVASLWLMRRRERAAEGAAPVPADAARAAFRTVAWLTVVGAAATVTVQSFVEITDRIGVPEFIASSVVLAVGTSMPELVVDWTAIRRGAAALAIGDLFGSSLVDATLSVGIGPMLVGVDVSPETVTGTLVIAVGVAVTTLTVALVSQRRRLAGSLLAIYAVTTIVLVSLTGSP